MNFGTAFFCLILSLFVSTFLDLTSVSFTFTSFLSLSLLNCFIYLYFPLWQYVSFWSYLFVYLSLCVPISLCTYLFQYLSLSVPISFWSYLFVYLSLSVPISFCTYLFLYLSLPIFNFTLPLSLFLSLSMSSMPSSWQFRRVEESGTARQKQKKHKSAVFQRILVMGEIDLRLELNFQANYCHWHHPLTYHSLDVFAPVKERVASG